MNFPLSSSSSISCSSSPSSLLQMTCQQQQQSKWDPHIDQLDILYAKMHGIASLSTSPPLSPLPYSTLSTNSSIHSIAQSTTSSSVPFHHNDGFQYSIQAVSPTNAHFSFNDYHPSTSTPSASSSSIFPTSSSSTTIIQQQQQQQYIEEEEEDTANLLIKNKNDHDSTKALLTMILSITNQLIQARFDYLSEEMFTLNNDHHHHHHHNDKEEQQLMMHFLTTCIQQAECLEQLISSQLKSKRTLNQYLYNEEEGDDIDEKELIQWYHDHIHQCIQLYEQQLFMTDTLQDILKDIETKSTYEEDEQEEENEKIIDDYNQTMMLKKNQHLLLLLDRWDFQQSIDHLLGLEDMNDRLSSLKYQVGMFIGNGLGTGHLIHSHKKKKKKMKKVSPPIEKTRKKHHHHQKNNNNIQPIYYLPQQQWIKDDFIQQCQYHQCKNKFSFFLRKHHCRSCGQIICHEHSTHQLPLYKKVEKDNLLSTSPSSPYLLCWSRVCDHCFTLYT
ncbi:unnamed protein product [Cunninghamella echinulata]